MMRTITILSIISFFGIIMYSNAIFAKSEVAEDITTHIGNEVQDSKSRSLALPSGLSENSLSLYDNPSRITDVSGIYLDGYAKETNLWGGTVIPLPFSIKAGFFLRRPLSQNSPLRNCLVEPSTGTKGAFTTMVDSGSTVLGIIDPESKYFKSETAIPNKSVSALATGDGDTKGFGNFDAFQGGQIGLVHLGIMESFSESSDNKSEVLANGSSRALGYSASEKRISAGFSTSPIGFLSADFSYTTAWQTISCDYDAATSATYPIFGYENLSESIHCKSAGNKELGMFFRTILSFDGIKVFGTIRYSRYNMPVDMYGKLSSSTSDDTHHVQYNTSYSAISYDVALHQTVSERCTVVYSTGYSRINIEYTKKTVIAPTTTDSSIWGISSIDDVCKKTIEVLPLGIAAEYEINEMIIARAGIRKYLWAPYDTSYTGSTGTLKTASRDKGKFASGDQFFASAGISIHPNKSIVIDADVDASNNEFSQTSTKSSSIRGGLSLRYLF